MKKICILKNNDIISTNTFFLIWLKKTNTKNNFLKIRQKNSSNTENKIRKINTKRTVKNEVDKHEKKNGTEKHKK